MTYFPSHLRFRPQNKFKNFLYETLICVTQHHGTGENQMRSKVSKPLKYLIYASKPFGFSQKDLDEILLKSKYNNKANDITGALLCRLDIYCQFLEGPEKELNMTYSKILSDDRHVDIQMLSSGSATRRLFTNWAMRGDPIKSWMWTREEVDEEILQRVTQSDALEIFVKHSKEIDQFL